MTGPNENKIVRSTKGIEMAPLCSERKIFPVSLWIWNFIDKLRTWLNTLPASSVCILDSMCIKVKLLMLLHISAAYLYKDYSRAQNPPMYR